VPIEHQKPSSARVEASSSAKTSSQTPTTIIHSWASRLANSPTTIHGRRADEVCPIPGC
jgi:hypothetical protein